MENLKKIFSRETISYGICGVITTLINILIFKILFGNFNVNYMIANIIAVVLAKIFSFLGNKFFVFQSHSKEKNQLFSEVTKYVLSRTFTGLIDILGLWLAVEILYADKMISKCIIQVITITINYVLTKNVVFRDARKDNNVDRKTARKNKKILKKEKKKYISPWKGLTIWGIVFLLGFGSLATVLNIVEPLACLFGYTELWKPVNKDLNAIYYSSDFKTKEEMLSYGKEICRQVGAEGAVLLKNENNALPLSKGSKVSCFSTSSVSPFFGGTGSGAYSVENCSNFKQALEESGFLVNETLWDFYNSKALNKYRRPQQNFLGSGSAWYEALWKLYTDDVLNSVNNYNDAAIIVLSRQGGERNEMETKSFNYLALEENEKDLFKNVCKLKSEGKIKKIIVLINASNPMEMSFLHDYSIDAYLQIGALGECGLNSIADILEGTTNPSGRLVDTWCYSNFNSPAMYNYIPNEYEGAKKAGVPTEADSYVVYQEGIYTGYRYYETRYEDYIMGTGNAGDYNYDSIVAFPFGYGISYTNFKYSDMKVTYDKGTDCYLIDVKVTNTGNFAGKEVVQAYFQSPYTDYDKEKGIEKASVALCGYTKTKALEPGESEIVTISVNKRDLASYDTYGAGTYILDAGDYYLTVATNAHSAVNHILNTKGFNSQNTNGRMKQIADSELTWKWTEDNFDSTTYSKTLNGTPIHNKLSLADPNLYEGVNEKITWLSRKDWTETFPKESVKLNLTPKLIQDLQRDQYQYQKHDSSEYKKPTMGAKNGLKLYDMLGKSYDDPEWNRLLDQLTYEDMVKLVASFHSRYAAKSVEAPGTRDENGTAGLNVGILAKIRQGAEATFFPSADVRASTFNKELTYLVGKVVGNNCLQAEVSCIYGPAVNLHRIPYGGRNLEYYSEDALLSGKTCANEVKGIEEKGVDTVVKHFALNEIELDRVGLGTWINEQTAREIYLRAFQPSFEETGANGVMASYIRWGAIWSGGVKNLITGILREEWNCKGWIISDGVHNTVITAADGLYAGLTMFDAPFPIILNFNKYKNDTLILNLMREACHRNLYALVNSSAMNGIGKDTTIEILELSLVTKFRYITIGLGLLTILFSIKWYSGNKKWKKALSEKIKLQ